MFEKQYYNKVYYIEYYYCRTENGYIAWLAIAAIEPYIAKHG
ncbi:hypothetical protein [Ruminococcus flavefaciens]|nr:hypothetical protein [Ruminococcus flavefaciens]MDD7516393.1 hypothetical protein [Ruminococcus flavefaciens]MDY5691075.1 hypothetical protein [Ruminococcus flavefaciens]